LAGWGADSQWERAGRLTRPALGELVARDDEAFVLVVVAVHARTSVPHFPLFAGHSGHLRQSGVAFDPVLVLREHNR
jgi:hypothetical protein